MSIIEELARETGANAGANLTYGLVVYVMIASVSNGKGRYWLLVLFIVAACAAYYFLLYLFR
jgi:phosphotransferase system  glucose/maltose/N-acetylglucosamine-specific IIC component